MPSLLAFNITADTWLPYRTLNTAGTLGMGISSPFWKKAV
jgi:hypothetical protein